jgi:hypothetical protein
MQLCSPNSWIPIQSIGKTGATTDEVDARFFRASGCATHFIACRTFGKEAFMESNDKLKESRTDRLVKSFRRTISTAQEDAASLASGA